MEQIIKFNNWLFSIDVEANISAYNNCPQSGADECPCDDCQNYARFRANIPDEIIQFFHQAGIDPRKESEVWRAARNENGQHLYLGWYHFKGKMIEGEDCKQMLGPTSFTDKLEPITPTFGIGFTKGNAPSIFVDKTNLVQIEFSTIIPWVLGHDSEPNW